MRERNRMSASGLRFGAHLVVQNLANLPRERVGGERLGQQVDVRIEPPLMDDGVARIAGDVEHLDGGLPAPHSIGQFSPVHAGRQHDIPAWSARETAAATLESAGGNEIVLVVEDDPQVNKLAVETLEERGYRVLSAPDGPTALTMLDTVPTFDLLLTDVVLPNGMNGRQLSEEVLRRRPDIKVLFVTGYTRNAIIHHGRLDPDIDLLTKPFTADALTRKIRQILDDNVNTKSVGA